MTPALWHDFNRTFRAEHRQIRDALLALVDALEERNRPRVQSLLGEIAALTGPHFRYEEEALYPALVQIFGQGYIDKLYADHDGAIASASRLVELSATDLSDAEVEEAVALVRGILPHVSDCDGLSIMVEVLDEGAVRSIFEARDRSRADDLDLLTWAREVRPRPLLAPAA